jgi:1-acyl-sn-glycerol-3-phosphate acyltransferase
MSLPPGQLPPPGNPLPSPLELWWYRTARAIVYGVSKLAWRYQVVGKDLLPQTTPYVLAPVHRSYLDTLFAGAISSRRPRFMAKAGVFSNKFAAALFRSLGGFPVRRGTADREALQMCESALSRGEPVVLFPEGTRGSGPVLGPLLPGPAYVALRAGVPIVPLGIGGSEQAMPVNAKGVRLNKVVVVVGKPIWPPPDRPAKRVPRNLVDEVTEQLRVELQELFDTARRLSGS